MYHHDHTAPCHRAVFLFVAIASQFQRSGTRLRACAINCRQRRLRYPFIILLLTVALLSIFSQTAQANVSVNLVVTVMNDESVPLSGVHVIIKELSWGGVSGWDGKLTFEGVPSGSYSLEASHIGYQLSKLRNIVIHQGSTTHIIMTLISKSLDLPDAEVYNNNEQTIIFNRESITILPDYWVKKGARTIGEALGDVPGITILQGDGRQRISLRGSPPHTVEVTLDHIPLTDAGTGTALIDRINLDHIQAINIEFSGLGGVVSLLTEYRQDRYTSDNGINLSFDKASNDYYGGNVSLERVQNNVKLLGQLSGFAEQGDFSYQLDNGISRQRIGNKAEGLTGMLKLKGNKKKGSLNVGIYYDESHHGVPGLINVSPTPEATLDSRRTSVGIHHESKFENYNLSSLAYFSNYSDHYQSPAEQFDPYSGEIINHFPENNRQRGRRWGLKSTVARAFNRGEVEVGYQVQSDKYTGEDLIRGTNTIGGIGLGGALRTVHDIQLETQFGKKWQNYRFDILTKLSQKYINNRNLSNDSFTSPGITIQVFRSLGNHQLTAHTGWGRSFVAPSFNAVFLEDNMFAVGNKKLKPERGENINLGLQYSLNTEYYGKFTGYANAFWRHTTDLIVWKRNSFNKYYPDNEDEVSQRGIELNLSADRIKGFISLRGGYIYNRSLIETDDDINRGNVPPLMAKHSGTMQLSIDYFRIKSTFSARWGGRRYSTASNLDPWSTAGMGLPPYTIWDVYTIRKFTLNSTEFSVQLGVDNLFDRNYRLIERSPMPGREYRIRTTFEF